MTDDRSLVNTGEDADEDTKQQSIVSSQDEPSSVEEAQTEGFEALLGPLLDLGNRALSTVDKSVETGVREAELRAESKRDEIHAWKSDRSEERGFRFRREILGAFMAGVPVFALVGVACYLLIVGRKDEAYWILSLLVIGSGGGGAGYAIGFNRGRREEQEAKAPPTDDES